MKADRTSSTPQAALRKWPDLPAATLYLLAAIDRDSYCHSITGALPMPRRAPANRRVLERERTTVSRCIRSSMAATQT